MTRLLLAAVMAALSVGCTAAGERPRVRIAIGGQTQMVYLPTTLADALGFYREAGIDVELQDFQGGAKALQEERRTRITIGIGCPMAIR